jgi:hypothetical protein
MSMELDHNGINSSDTTLRLVNSTIREETASIFHQEKTEKENMSPLQLLTLVEFNKDGSLDMLINPKDHPLKVKDPEELILEDLSISDLPCGWEELLLITTTTMLTSPLRNQEINNNFGYTTKLLRPLSLTGSKICLSIIEEDTLLSKRLIQDGTNSGPILKVDILKPILLLVPTKRCMLLFKAKLTLKTELFTERTTRLMKTIKNGTLSMLMIRLEEMMKKPRNGVSQSTDLSELSLKLDHIDLLIL